MRLPWIKIAAALLVIWALAGGIGYWAHSARPTPETVIRYIDGHPVAGLSAGDRRSIADKLAKQLNQLTYQQRREGEVNKRVNVFFRGLPADEQNRFLDLTLPAGYKQMMDSLNKMTREKRKQFVEKTLADMKKHEDEGDPDGQRQLDANGQKVIDEGFKSFYSDASAETKMDLAPLIEQLQRNLQGIR